MILSGTPSATNSASMWSMRRTWNHTEWVTVKKLWRRVRTSSICTSCVTSVWFTVTITILPSSSGVWEMRLETVPISRKYMTGSSLMTAVVLSNTSGLTGDVIPISGALCMLPLKDARIILKVLLPNRLSSANTPTRWATPVET